MTTLETVEFALMLVSGALLTAAWLLIGGKTLAAIWLLVFSVCFWIGFQ